MFIIRAILAAVLLPLLAGCSLTHFRRGTSNVELTGEAAPAQAVAELSLERKVLQQELALARKEGDALRTALDHNPTGGRSPESVARLNETTRELATLRASYAKLSAERAASNAAAKTASDAVSASGAKVSELEEKLATSLRTYTQLQEETAQLRTDLERARHENVALNARFKNVVASNDQAQGTLTQLSAELLEQKEARSRAEQATAAARAELAAGVAQNTSTESDRAPLPPRPIVPEIAQASPSEVAAKADLERARTENVALNAELKNIVASNHQVQATLTQLSAELLEQKDARRRAEQATAAARAELAAAIAQNASAASSLGSSTPNPAAPEIAKAPPTRVAATAEFRTNPSRVNVGRESTKPVIRVYLVQAGDTLRNIARRYYDDPERWRSILEANSKLLGAGRPLQPGMELRIPPP